MKAVKYLAGAAAAAALTVGAASPAQAQYWDPYRSNDRGVDVGDIITGVAVVGGIAAILGAFNRDGSRYGYANQNRYRNDYRSAVNACAYQADRFGRGGRVSVTDIDRRGANSYRVRGVIDAGYSDFGRYDRFGGSGRYDNRYGYDRYDQRVAFACTARANGRVTDFDIDRRY